MKHFYLYNAVLAVLLFALWFGIAEHGTTLGGKAAFVLLLSFFVGFYAASFLTLYSRFHASALALSFVSALIWTVASVFVSLWILMAIFGRPEERF